MKKEELLSQVINSLEKVIGRTIDAEKKEIFLKQFARFSRPSMKMFLELLTPAEK